MRTINPAPGFRIIHRFLLCIRFFTIRILPPLVPRRRRLSAARPPTSCPSFICNAIKMESGAAGFRSGLLIDTTSSFTFPSGFCLPSRGSVRSDSTFQTSLSKASSLSLFFVMTSHQSLFRGHLSLPGCILFPALMPFIVSHAD